jgi:hypothetical protein
MNIRLPRFGRARTPVIVVASAIIGGVLFTATGASAAVAYVLLGRSNYAASQTNISNSAGTPLGLNARSGYAPLYVNSSRQVARLNADYVNGYHASSFAKVTGKTGIIAATDNGAVCPAGTFATGGGGAVYRLDAAGNATALPTYYSGPDFTDAGALIPNSWIVLPDDAGLKDTTVHYDSYVVCYNPKGAVAGASSTLPGAASTAKAGLVKARAATR